MWVSSIMGLDKLILPDGRNRLGGYMTTVSVISYNDSWWNELQHYARTARGRNRLGGYMTTVSVIGNNNGWWNELQRYASMRQELQFIL